MNNFSDFFSKHNPLLLVLASASEFNLVLSALNKERNEKSNALHFDSLSILECGVGKTKSTLALCSEIFNSSQIGRAYKAVLSFGIAGSYYDHIQIGSSVFASSFLFADEGSPLGNMENWQSLEAAGWAQTTFNLKETEWSHFLASKADFVGPIATVSTISGTDYLAKLYAQRTEALAEGMEGAALAQVCQHFGLNFAELRVISNRCGERSKNPLDISRSFKSMASLVESWKFEE